MIKEYAPVRTKLYPAISLYDTLGKDAVSYILNHIEAKCVFVGDEKKLESILSILDELQFLELIVTFEGLGWEKSISICRIFSDWRCCICEKAEVNLINKVNGDPSSRISALVRR